MFYGIFITPKEYWKFWDFVSFSKFWHFVPKFWLRKVIWPNFGLFLGIPAKFICHVKEDCFTVPRRYQTWKSTCATISMFFQITFLDRAFLQCYSSKTPFWGRSKKVIWKFVNMVWQIFLQVIYIIGTLKLWIFMWDKNFAGIRQKSPNFGQITFRCPNFGKKCQILEKL